MITQSEYKARRQALLAQLDNNSVAVIHGASEMPRSRDVNFPFRQSSDFYYLTGFNEPDAILILAPKHELGETILFVKPRDPKFEVWNGKLTGLEGAVEQYGADKAYAIEAFDATLPLFLEHRQQRDDIPTLIAEMRLFKSDNEIQCMQKAADISVNAHKKAMQCCQPGMYEYQLEAEMLREFYYHGSRFPAYPSIVGAGKNSCVLHYVTNNAELNASDLVLIDAGAEIEGYAADITRTFPVSGQFSKKQAQLYNWVLKAQMAGIEQVKPGTPWPDIQKVMLKIIVEGLIDLKLLSGDPDQLLEQKAYLPYYMHNSGHWLGLDVHDVGEYKKNDSWRQLAPGMVLTVEPGIYVAEWNMGVRIEDDVLVTEQGSRVLSAALPKTIEDIESLMASA